MVAAHSGNHVVITKEDIVGDFTADQRRDTLYGVQNRLGQRDIFAVKNSIHHGFGGGFGQQQFVLRRWQNVAHTRQDGTHGGHGIINALHGVNDAAILIYNNKVTMTAHDFDDTADLNDIAHFIAGLEDNFQNSVQTHLFQTDDAGADKMFAHQHTEHRRSLWIFKGSGGQVDAGAVCTRGDVKFAVSVSGTENEDQFLAGNLVDFIHLRVQDLFLQFMLQLFEKRTVQSHRSHLVFYILRIIFVSCGRKYRYRSKYAAQKARRLQQNHIFHSSEWRVCSRCVLPDREVCRGIVLRRCGSTALR